MPFFISRISGIVLISAQVWAISLERWELKSASNHPHLIGLVVYDLAAEKLAPPKLLIASPHFTILRVLSLALKSKFRRLHASCIQMSPMMLTFPAALAQRN
jgi:hypothetical protein